MTTPKYIPRISALAILCLTPTACNDDAPAEASSATDTETGDGDGDPGDSDEFYSRTRINEFHIGASNSYADVWTNCAGWSQATMDFGYQ